MLEILVLLFTFIVGIIAVAAVKQYQEEREAELRRFIEVQKGIIRQTEALISENPGIPLGKETKIWLLRRVLRSLERIYECRNTEAGIEKRIRSIRLTLLKFSREESKADPLDKFKFPKDAFLMDKSIKFIRDLRQLLIKEYRFGRVSSESFQFEDEILSFMQSKIGIEGHCGQALASKSNSVFNNARASFNKALTILQIIPESEYKSTRIKLIESHLVDIDQREKTLNSEKQRQQDEYMAIQAEKAAKEAMFEPKPRWN